MAAFQSMKDRLAVYHGLSGWGSGLRRFEWLFEPVGVIKLPDGFARSRFRI
jgi:hypothetical protein